MAVELVVTLEQIDTGDLKAIGGGLDKAASELFGLTVAMPDDDAEVRQEIEGLLDGVRKLRRAVSGEIAGRRAGFGGALSGVPQEGGAADGAAGFRPGG